METVARKKLLFAHFYGQLTALEVKGICLWLQERSNQELYYQWLEEWDRLNPLYNPDENLMWQKLEWIQRNRDWGSLHLPTQWLSNSRTAAMKMEGVRAKKNA
jgi:hypothetical protein